MTGVNDVYNIEERAIVRDIENYRQHIRYNRERADFLEQEVDRLRRVLRDSLANRGIDYERTCLSRGRHRLIGKNTSKCLIKTST